MSAVTTNQPLGTPTWIDLGIPDLDRAMAFYGSVLGWEFDIGPEEYGRYTMCLLGGKKVAALMPNLDENATEFWWNVYLATYDVDATVARSVAAGGALLTEPMDIADQGRMAIVRDPSGAQFGLWQGRAHVGCELVNEPNTLLRNDLVTPNPGPAREFYAAVFDFIWTGTTTCPAWISPFCADRMGTRSAASWVTRPPRRPPGARSSR
nr:VOC family protein [Rhodococcus sp. GA1]